MRPSVWMLCFVLGLVAVGCKSSERREFYSLEDVVGTYPELEGQRSLLALLRDAPGERLVSIYTTLRSQDGCVIDRILLGDRLRAEKIRFHGGRVTRHTFYDLRAEGVVDSFIGIHKMAAGTHRFVAPSYRESAQPAYVGFVIACGSRRGVAHDEGGLLSTDIAFREADRWEEMRALGEPIEDGTLALHYLADTAFESQAAILLMVVMSFDGICQTAYEHQNPEHVAPEPAGVLLPCP